MRHGRKYRVNLVDGSSLEGTLRFSWGWSSYRLVDCVFINQAGVPVEADGFFIVPKRSILHVQGVSD